MKIALAEGKNNRTLLPVALVLAVPINTPRSRSRGNVWSAVRLQAKSLWRVIWVCANVSGLFVELPLLAIMESARRWSTKWVELQRVLIPTQA
jgi:hypothetical protein